MKRRENFERPLRTANATLEQDEDGQTHQPIQIAIQALNSLAVSEFN
jgi:hypothetical protein